MWKLHECYCFMQNFYPFLCVCVCGCVCVVCVCGCNFPNYDSENTSYELEQEGQSTTLSYQYNTIQ